MNIAEISNEFDYAYNNSFSFSAPPINGYEKSIALTQAQEDIVLAKAAVAGIPPIKPEPMFAMESPNTSLDLLKGTFVICLAI